MKRIDDVEDPQVGRFYIVPCIEEVHTRVDCGSHRFIPVIGPWHEDSETVKFNHWHYHYDWRFMPESSLTTPSAFSHSKVAMRNQNQFNSNDALPITFRRKRMLRTMLTFPGNAPWLVELEDQFERQRLNCRTCPHRGMPLSGLPADENGRVVCPGHGLRWNLKTGELSRRTTFL